MQRLAEEEVNGGGSQKEATVDVQKTVYFDELNMTEEERQKRREAAKMKGNAKKFRRQDPYHLPEQDLSFSKDDPRMMTEDELARYAEEYKDSDDVGLYDTSNIDFQSPEFAALPITVQYQLLNTARLRSRLRMGYSKEQLDQIFPDRLEFSKFQIARVKERNMLTQKLFNLNGMAEDLSMRIAGERDKEYVLKKNENGWTLALEDASAAQPIKLDDDEDCGDSEDDDDDGQWEDVPLQPAFKTALPRPDQLTRGSFILPGIHDTNESKTVDSQPEDIPLFNLAEDDDEDDLLNVGVHDEEEDLQNAIALSLRSSTSAAITSTNLPEQHYKALSEIDSPKEDNATEDVTTAGPFLWDTGDAELDPIIKNLPKLPDKEPEDEISERRKPTIAFTPSRFNLKNSLLNRKRNREDNTTIEENSSAAKRVFVDASSSPAVAITTKDDENSQQTKTGLDEVFESRPSQFVELASVDDKEEPQPSDPDDVMIMSELMPNKADSPLIKVEPLTLTGATEKVTSKIETPESVKSEKSPEWEDVPVEIPVTSPADVKEIRSSSPEREDTSANTKVESTLPSVSNEIRASSPEWDMPESPSSPSASQKQQDDGDDGDEDDEQQIDFEEQEDEELVDKLVHEVQEHARFASEINPQSRRVEYDREIKELRNQQRSDRRDADTVTNVMVQECQELLARFGIPYVTAPMEAEAQCAELLRLGLVDGVITDDSDIFLFGASKVYKNMFNQAKFVECYLSSDLQKELQLDQKRMIELAHLLGSDYTPGIPGVGPVTAVQLVNDFKSENTLQQFKEWFERIQRGEKDVDVSSTFRKKFKKKSKKLFLNPLFPDRVVDEAYLKPTTDKDETDFVWGTPDLDRIREFLMSAIGWSKERADEVLVPLIKTMNLKRQSLQFSKRGFGVR